MNTLILVVLGLAMVAALPRPGDQDTQILKQEQEVGPDTFSYNFELDDGTSANSRGQIKNPEEPDREHRVINVIGEYKFVADNGKLVHVKYTADEDGFHPEIVSSAQ
ncbi:unnamed protein product [Allacma fusca]|uniref:Uncharacterized protein n=1 Tax=Allacma fusca TaxID=39272 RepID=A0A8J2LML9_9HEXA|nr:unnamed protein product [Allacma fusca]